MYSIWLLYLYQYGNTPLQAAALNGFEEVVRLLLVAGASVDAKDKVRRGFFIFTHAFVFMYIYSSYCITIEQNHHDELLESIITCRWWWHHRYQQLHYDGERDNFKRSISSNDICVCTCYILLTWRLVLLICLSLSLPLHNCFSFTIYSLIISYY